MKFTELQMQYEGVKIAYTIITDSNGIFIIVHDKEGQELASVGVELYPEHFTGVLEVKAYVWNEAAVGNDPEEFTLVENAAEIESVVKRQ